MDFHLNDDLFFLVEEGILYAWDYRAHKQFRLSLEAFAILVDPNRPGARSSIRDTLIECGLLLTERTAAPNHWGWDVLSRIFHFGTSRPRPAPRQITPAQASLEYVEHCASILSDIPPDAFETRRGYAHIPLAPYDDGAAASISELLESRRTSRRFAGNVISLAHVSRILDETFRYRVHDQSAYSKMGMSTPCFRRSAPAGGSLQACEAYTIARRVEGLSPGIYHFESDRSTLARVRDIGPSFSFGDLLGGQSFADDLSAAVIITCRLDKLMWKYSQSRSYRVALIEAGHLSQNLQLLATDSGLLTWPTAAFYDDELAALLGVDISAHEVPLLVVGLGTGIPFPFDRDLGSGFHVD